MASLVIKITSGIESLERCNQGFTVATMGIAAGADVSVWLTGEAVRFAEPGFAETVHLELAASFAEAVATIRDAGTLTACSQCLARRHLTADALLPGVRVAGAAAFVEEVLAPEAKALVY